MCLPKRGKSISAYRPMLCLAKVNLADGTTVKLTRYIDFPVDE